MSARARESRGRRALSTLLPVFVGAAIAACTPGEGGGQGDARADAAGAGVWLEEGAEAAGIRFVYRSGHAGAYLMPEIMGGGAALFDADDDGDLDAYCVQGGSLLEEAPNPPNQLFENDGKGRFEDVTEESGAGDRGYGMGVACGDADGDGRTDLYVTNLGANALLLNRGACSFEDTTAGAGAGHPAWGASAAFLDRDRDGDLDLFVVNYLDWIATAELPCSNNLNQPDYCSPKVYKLPTADVLYDNDGHGAFADRSRELGIAAARGTGLGISTGDLDGDGWIDVFVANDGMPDVLWRNLSGTGFEDVAPSWGCAVDVDGIAKAGMGVALADVDADLDLDLLVCNLNRESDSLFLNQGGHFADRTASVGLAAVTKPFTRFGMAWIDLDHDGALDLYQANGRVNRQARTFSDDPYAEPNMLLRGSADGRFRALEPRGGTREPLPASSRAAAFGDVDGDGGVDVLVVNRDAPAHLLLNRAPGRGGWILLRVLETSGRDALGASLELVAGDRRIRRDVLAAYSYLASNDPRVHVGLGDAPGVDAIVVRWVDGSLEAFGPREGGRVHVLRRGEGSPP